MAKIKLGGGHNQSKQCEQNFDQIFLFNLCILCQADVPERPNPVLAVVDVLTAQVEWEAPFTWEDFPITNYTVTVGISNQTYSQLETVILGLDTLSYNLTQTAPSSSCTNVTFTVVASSSVGPSAPGVAQGSFPSSKFATARYTTVISCIIISV